MNEKLISVLEFQKRLNSLDMKSLDEGDVSFVDFLKNLVCFYNDLLWERVGRSEVKFWIDNKIMRLKSAKELGV